MSWFKRLQGDEEYRAGLAAPAGWLVDAIAGIDSYSGIRVTVKDALELAAVRSAVAMISEAVGGLPLKVYRVMNEDDRVEARGHRTWRMLHDKPNSMCTARRFWATTAAQLLVYENSFIEKERDPFSGEVASLYHLDPSQWRVEVEAGRKLFIFDGPPVRRLTEDDVLHIVGFSLNGYYGDARISQAKQTLAAGIARAQFEGGFWKRGGMVPGMLSHPGRLNDKASARISDQMAKWHGGVQNMHKWPVLEEGMQPVKAGMTMEEMQFAQLAEQTRTEVAVLFNIPPAYLGATTGDSLTYATTESNQIQFGQMAVLPIADTIAKALSSDPSLLPWDVMYAEFVIEALFRADMKSRAEYWKTMKDVLGLDPEYIASRENIPRDALKEPEPVPQVVLPGENGNGAAPDPTQNPAMMAQAAKVRAVS